MSEQSSRLVIILDSSGAQRNSESLADALNRLTAQGERATGATDNLGFSFKRLAASAAGALSIGAVIKIADDWGQVAARIKMALKSVEGDIKNYADIQERFLEISNRNGKNIEDVQLLYIGAATSMQELGYNTTQTIDYIESLSSAMTANASSANEVMSMQNALNKAMVAGKVAGENWNSIMNATPTLLGDIARQLEKQNGGIKVTEAQVKKMAAEGKISFKLFAEAVMAAKDANNALADSMDNTVADGFNRVINSAKAYYGELNQSLGITRSMSAGLAVLSDNFSAVSTVITSIVGIGVARYFGNMATSMKTAAKETINQTRTAKENAKAQLDVATQEQRRAAAAVRNAQLDRARLQNDINRNARTRQSALLSAEYTAALSRERAAKLALVQANNAVAASQERLNTITSIGARVTGMVRGGLALIGGPVGLAMLAAGGMYAWYESTKQAKEEARNFSHEIPELVSNLEKLNRVQAEGAKVKLTQNIRQLKEDAVDAKKEVESLSKDLEQQKGMTNIARSDYARNVGLEKERDLTEKLILKRAELDSITTKLSYSEESLGKVNSYLSLKTVEQMQAARQQQDALDTLEPKVKLLSDAQAFLAQKIGITTNAMRQFNAQSLLLNYGGEDANKLIEGMKQQVELSEKTGKARAQLAAEQAAKRAGANEGGIKEAIRLAGIEYDNLEKQRELTKSKNATYSESAAQKMLSSLKEQQMVLIQQSATNEKLGSQAQALVKWQQEIKDIEEKKAKGKLTAEQKSLLASKALITKELERNVQLEQAIKNREAEVKIAAYNKQLMEETAQAQMQYEQTLEMTGKGSLEQGRLQEKFQLQNEFQKKQAELLKQYQDKSTGMTKEMYEKETQFLSEQLQKRLAILDEFHAKQNEQRENWKLGLQKGFAEFQEQATDVYGNVAQISQSAFQGMSNSLSDFVLTGKANFADFTRSFLEMTTKMLMQMAMLNAMKAAFGGNAVGNFLGLKGHSEGGYTGDGGKYQPMGIVHGGEFVFTKEATQRLGIANLYRLMDYGQKGYASGGYVGGSAPMSVTQPTAFIARNPQVAGGGVNVTIDMSGVKIESGQQQSAMPNIDVRAAEQSLKNKVKSLFISEGREGGDLYKIIKAVSGNR
ncbi:phage tail tape measure protein [Providencia stuartii]|uniref:phage tail tape measure protein n=1 Tax=Providencia stuartii TaxID=588 RepID=UPI00288CECA7|nr:phage tail tape measure protein [Providencia stuartii]MDT2016841.1 phage tail tape measure protein [Providencia stuartii]MDT2082916.1 phage tail tape measure protein [Providencia stuartii]